MLLDTKHLRLIQLIAMTSAISVLGGCSTTTPEESPAPPPEPVKTQKVVPPPNDSGIKRGTLIRQANNDIKATVKAKAKAKQAASPRVKLANSLRPWTEMVMEGTGITGWMKTRWADDQILIRLAFLGPRESLNSFMPRVQLFKLTLKDMQNAPVLFYTITPNDFQWAPPTVNNGTPTMQFESSAPCSLEEYERCNLWKLDWDWN